MTDPELEGEDARERRSVQGAMTLRLAGRQFVLLLAAATALLCVAFFFDLYGTTFVYWWQTMEPVSFKYFAVHPLLLLIYGYVLLNGIVFALGPSERSFGFFFGSMMFALVVAHYDQSIIDWFLSLFAGARFKIVHVVDPFKILFSGVFLLCVVSMHYNILADDFARRMLRRGVPTEEVAAVRPGMFRALVPTMLTASAIAFGLSLVGWFAGFIFGDLPLLPKLELFLLAGLVVPMAFLIRNILRDLVRKRSGNAPPQGPNG